MIERNRKETKLAVLLLQLHLLLLLLKAQGHTPPHRINCFLSAIFGEHICNQLEADRLWPQLAE